MNGEAIASQAIGEAALRRLATEYGGPRPPGTREQETARPARDDRVACATRP
jgi:hypothetical protein